MGLTPGEPRVRRILPSHPMRMARRILTLPRFPSPHPSGERAGVRGFEPEYLVPPHHEPSRLVSTLQGVRNNPHAEAWTPNRLAVSRPVQGFKVRRFVSGRSHPDPLLPWGRRGRKRGQCASAPWMAAGGQNGLPQPAGTGIEMAPELSS
jgi:hypothetical protein